MRHKKLMFKITFVQGSFVFAIRTLSAQYWFLERFGFILFFLADLNDNDLQFLFFHIFVELELIICVLQELSAVVKRFLFMFDQWMMNTALNVVPDTVPADHGFQEVSNGY